MPDRNKVIAIAIAETGYLEKSKSAYQKNPDILNEKTAGAGRDNHRRRINLFTGRNPCDMI